MPRKPKRRAVIAEYNEDDDRISLFDAHYGSLIDDFTTAEAYAYFGIDIAPGESPTLLLNPPRIVKKRKAVK